eukprot:9248021-Pyramimonas_sp.AAC.1
MASPRPAPSPPRQAINSRKGILARRYDGNWSQVAIDCQDLLAGASHSPILACRWAAEAIRAIEAPRRGE